MIRIQPKSSKRGCRAEGTPFNLVRKLVQWTDSRAAVEPLRDSRGNPGLWNSCGSRKLYLELSCVDNLGMLTLHGSKLIFDNCTNVLHCLQTFTGKNNNVYFKYLC